MADLCGAAQICRERRIDTIIIKCCHAFCKECVGASTKGRNRNCPGCQKKFGHEDVKRLFLA